MVDELWLLLKDCYVFFVNYIFLVWAHCPVLPLSDDENYPGLELPLRKNKSIRISLFSIYFGEFAFFFMSWNFAEKKFSMVKKLRMKDLPTFNDEKSFNQECENFNHHIDRISSNGNSEKNIQAERDFLSKEIESQTNRITRCDNKFSVFSAISLAIIPFLWKDIYEAFLLANVIEKIILCLIVYFFANICFLTIQHIGVQSVTQYKFGKIVECPDNMDGFLLKKMYYNWVYKKNQARLMVSSLCRVYDFLKLIGFLAIIFFICTVAQNSYFVCKNQSISSKLYVMSESKTNEVYSNDKIKLMELEIQLGKMQFERVIIMSNKPIQGHLKEELSKYAKQKISYIIDESLDYDVVKILLEN